MGAVAGGLDLRTLLALRTAVAADVQRGRVLIRCDVPGTMQLFEVPLDGGELRQLTQHDDPVEGKYVPGTETVLLMHDIAGNERTQFSLLVDGDERPLVHDPAFVHRDPCPSRDGSLLAYATNRDNGVDWGVYVRELAGGRERKVHEASGWNGPVGFAPDARVLVVEHMSGLSGDNDLYLVDVEAASVRRASPERDDPAWFEPPVWRPDGSAFFCATNHDRDTFAVSHYDVDGDRWETVVESEWDLQCLGDDAGRWLLVHVNEEGYSRLELRNAETLARHGDVPLPGRGVVERPLLAKDGSALVFKFSSPTDPGDVWAYRIDDDELVRLTELPRPLPSGELREPTLHRFASFDGESIPVFVWEPDGDGPFPVVVMIHGGPESQFRPAFLQSFTPFTQHLVSRGYAVAAPNVRGSTGYGKRFEHLDDVRLRLDSVRDLASLHDWLGSRPRIDASRAALYGRSYGGYMVLAGLVFQPERWAAGIECVGISNFVTFLENTAAWRRAVREPEYGSLERDRDFLIEASPITHVDQIRAPLFIQHGANDPRVPLEETEQIHRVLTEKGIRCELLVHEDEGHSIGKLENRVETFERAVAFLEDVLNDRKFARLRRA
jgi:dipeptidyl aminopeptidase/acylaminoacyl peptidase